MNKCSDRNGLVKYIYLLVNIYIIPSLEWYKDKHKDFTLSYESDIIYGLSINNLFIYFYNFLTETEVHLFSSPSTRFHSPYPSCLLFYCRQRGLSGHKQCSGENR